MKSTLALFLSMALLAPAIAHADATRHKGIAAADFELLPSGTFDGSFPTPLGTISGSQSLDTAYGVGLLFENPINDLISVGLAPRFLFNVITKNDNGDASNELDVRVRVAAGHELIPKLRLYGFGAPGYSVIFPPKNNNGDTVHPNGFVIEAGGGLSFALTPSLLATFEVGYQWGFQSWSDDTALGTLKGDASTSYLSLGFGLAAAID
jgi:hypothetical protein